jgi:hypothetical protein
VPIELSYASHRDEVWRWYWKAWPRRFLPLQAVIVAWMCGLSVLLRGPAPIEIALVKGLLLSALLIAGFVAYPQATFKPQVRTLTVDDDGVLRKQGSQSIRRSWREISSIVDDDGYIVMETKGGAFIVPPSAFASDIARADFVAFVTAARAAAAGAGR